MGAGPVGGSVVYSEDRVGVTGRLWAWLAVPVVVQLVLCLTTPVAFWAAALGATGSVELFSLVLLHQCWETGIRVTTDEVRIGGCRRAERLAAKRRLPPAVIDPHYRLRNQFSVPIAAIGSARVLRRPEFAELPGKVVTPAGAGRRPVKQYSFVNLRSPLASAALLLEVDLHHASMPAMATYMIERFAPTRTSSRYVLTNRWTVATRHPEALRAALTQVGVPVTPSDPSGLLPASSS
jgi:hypothetical protein